MIIKNKHIIKAGLFLAFLSILPCWGLLASQYRNSATPLPAVAQEPLYILCSDIREAVYGDLDNPAKQVDVTQIIKDRLAATGTFEIAAERLAMNRVFTDPAPGVFKKLKITYVNRKLANVGIALFPEGSRVKIVKENN